MSRSTNAARDAPSPHTMESRPASLLSRVRAWRDHSTVLRALARPLAERLKRRTGKIPFGAGRGLRFCAAGGTLGYALGLEEPLVQRALRAHLRPDDTFYDIGANVGFFAVIGARRVGPAGRVYAFEPVPETAAQLRANAALNEFRHVYVREEAVSDHTGVATLRLGDVSQVAKLDGATEPLGGSGRQIEVPLVTVDALVARGEIAPPDFVMMDVEGAEVSALRGMTETLRHHRPIVLCELHGTHAAVAALLRAHGYRLTVLEHGGPAEEAPEHAHVLALPYPPA